MSVVVLGVATILMFGLLFCLTREVCRFRTNEHLHGIFWYLKFGLLICLVQEVHLFRSSDSDESYWYMFGLKFECDLEGNVWRRFINFYDVFDAQGKEVLGKVYFINENEGINIYKV